MPIMPRGGRFPSRLSGTDQGYYYCDNRNTTNADQFDRTGPFLCEYVPASGELQVPQTSKGAAIMVTVDAHVWLPLASGCKARSILVELTSGLAYTVLFTAAQGERIEALVKRQLPS